MKPLLKLDHTEYTVAVVVRVFPMVDQSVTVPCPVTCQVTFVNRGQSAFD